MRRTIIICIVALLSIAACKKYTNYLDSSKNAGTVYGNAYFINNFVGTGDSIVLANKKIYIKDANDATGNYLFYVTTDANGYFQFSNLSHTTRFVIFTHPDSLVDPVSGAVFFGSDTFSIAYQGNNFPAINVSLVAKVDTTHENGLQLFITDSGALNPIAGVKMLIYPSPQSALADSTYSGTGAICQLTSDSIGRVFKARLPYDSSLYIKAVFNNGKVILKNDTVIIPADSMRKVGVTRRAPISLYGASNYLLVTTEVDSNTLFPDVNILIYNSLAMAEADTGFNGLSAIARATSASNGQALFYVLPAQTLYISAYYNANGILLKNNINSGIITMYNKGFFTKTIQLDTAYRSLLITTEDTYKDPIPGATSYLYTSKAVFNDDINYTGNGAISPTLISNNYGTAYIAKLPNDTVYYLRSIIKIGSTTTLEDTQTVFLRSGIWSNTDTIKLQ